MKALLPFLFVMAAGALAIVLAGCSVALPVRTPKEVVDTPVPLATRAEIPAIDARAPADVETATFALG
jgi:hypothetical protein